MLNPILPHYEHYLSIGIPFSSFYNVFLSLGDHKALLKKKSKQEYTLGSEVSCLCFLNLRPTTYSLYGPGEDTESL